MNQNINLNLLKYFYEVVNTSNITKASEKLLVSQPAITKAIKELENELNVSLLKKKTLYNNNITSLEKYIELVEEWIEFYNTTRIKGKKVNKKKGYKKNDK